MIYIACDHGGYTTKLKIIGLFEKYNLEYQDLGTNTTDSVDYPDYAEKLAKAMEKNPEAVGVLICTTGIGMSIAINRYKFLRGALCHSVKDAKMSRAHNNANVLVMGANMRFHKRKKIVNTFLSTEFEGGRHEKRVEKLGKLG